MPTLIRVVLICLLSAGLTLLLGNSGWMHGLMVITLTALLTISILGFLDNPRNWWLALLALLLMGGLIMLGINHGMSWLDMGLSSMTVVLSIILVSMYLDPDDQWWGFVALLVTPPLVLLWLHFQGAPPQPPGGGITQAELQFRRIVQALGADNQEPAQHELGALCGLPNSDTWKNGPCDTIPTSGPWPLRVFFPGFDNDGNALAVGLWGQRVEALQIADTNARSLQPLLGCRNAVRGLFGKSRQYTPLFQLEDFGGSNNPFEAMEDKIYKWTDKGHPDALREHRCTTKLKGSEKIVEWIKTCMEPISGGFTDDKDLQQIKTLGKACGVVQFVGK